MRKTLLTTILATMPLLEAQSPTIAEPIKYQTPTSLDDYFVKTDSVSYRATPENLFNNPNLMKIADSQVGIPPKEANYISEKEFWEITDSLYNKIDVPEEITKDIFYAFVKKESSFNINAYNKRTGASGLTQMRPDAWRDVDNETSYVMERFTKEKNLENGLRYLKWTTRALNKMSPGFADLRKDDKLRQIVATFNWGIGNLKDNNWEFASAPKETRDYYDFVVKEIAETSN